MARKKKVIRRDPASIGSQGETHPKAGAPPPAEAEKARIPKRVREKDSGFGVIKAVVGGIIVLILGSTVLFNKVGGGRESARGDTAVGHPCEKTVECQKGSVCYAYRGGEKQCMETCYDGKCPEGYDCVGAASQKRRKGIRITDICVRNENL